MKAIPLFDLSRQFEPLQTEINAKLQEIFSSTSFVYGENVKTFESLFSNLVGTKYSLGVASGTASLFVSLLALGLGPGDEVITTSATFAATVDAIALTGAKPVFADIDPTTGNLDPEKVFDVITKKTKAILIVHLYGVPCEMDTFVSLAKAKNLYLLEDASHAHGSIYKNKKVGSFGIAGCFSLYPSKTLGSAGNSGIISSNDKQFISTAKKLANHGMTNVKYKHDFPGLNELMSEIQGAILSIKIKQLPLWIERKKRIAEYYNSILNEFGNEGMYWPKYTNPSLYVYAFQVKNRKLFRDHFAKHKIATGVYYPTPIHKQKYYQKNNVSTSLKNSEHFFSKTVSLPLFSDLTDAEVERVGQVIKKYYKV